MSKGCRHFLLLAAFIMGLGVLGGANEVGAAQVTGVTVSTPDSGAVRGIDSLIVATATVFDVPSSADLTVMMWLVVTNKDSLVGEVGDATADVAYEYYDDKKKIRRVIGGGDFAAENNTLANINADIAALQSTVTTPTVVAQTLHRDGVTDVDGRVAVLKTKNTDDNDLDSKDFVGNADSVATAGITNGTSFTWYLRVPPEVADLKRVRVAAVVVDTTSTTTGTGATARLGEDPVVKVSPESEQFRIDGDRPANPVSNDPFDGGAGTAPNQGSGNHLLSTYADPYGPVAEDLNLFGELKPGAITVLENKRKGKVVGGFPRGNSRVLGIGDSLHLRLSLGDDAGRILLGDDEVAVKAFGKYLVADKNNNDDGVVQFDVQIADGMFGAFAGGQTAKIVTTAPAEVGVDTAFNHDNAVYVAPNDANNDGSIDPPTEGESGTRHVAPATDTIRFGYIDPAGNFSGDIDGPEIGKKALAFWYVDTKAPALDAAKFDTIVPVSDDTITDGTLNDGFPSDTNTVIFKLAESLDSLFVTFDGADVDVSFIIPNSSDPPNINDGVLKKNPSESSTILGVNDRIINFTTLGNARPGDDEIEILNVDMEGKHKSVATFSGEEAGVTYKRRNGVKDTSILTGMHTIKFKARDFGGNVGPELERENVYVDVDDLKFNRLFPTKAGFGKVDEARLDTLEEETAKLSFSLSEPADSVLITYAGYEGPDKDKMRTRRLSGSELTNTGAQLFPIDSLMHDTKYTLTVLGRDIAGNWTQAGPDSFIYDTTHAVPTIKRFTIAGKIDRKEDEDDVDAVGLDKTKHAKAGEEVTLTLTADASVDGSRDAVTYREEAILKVAVSGTDAPTTGVALEGTGVTDMGGGRAILSKLDWVTGSRTVTLTDTAAIETLMVSIVDSASADGPFAGALDSSIVVITNDFAQVVVSAPDTITQGEDFWVDVALGDKFANARLKDNRYVSITANKLGVQVPMGDHLISGGRGGFTANSGTFAGAGLVITVRDIVPAKTGEEREGTGDDFVDGQSAPIYVAMPGEVIVDEGGVDAPDTLIVEDYKGADGAGDQGGFLLLTWDLSDNHSPGSGGVYRIYREVSVNYDAPGEGDDSGASVVELDSPSMVALPWAKVDMIPAEDIGRAIVATLDNVATRWFIAAEIGAATSARGKHAFSDVSSFLSPDALMAETMVPGLATPAPIASAESPYELMAETMVASKQAVMVDPDAPVIATLTPQALAFAESGTALRLKGTETEVRSSDLTPSAEGVAAIDNIAPEPITYLRVMDTPGDAGASIDVLWTKSESDRLVPRSAAGAVGRGGVGDLVSGVVGYNVYRKAGNEELILVGSANAGETSFSDITALNGVRYTYQVSPFDNDNVAHSDLERTAMAIRNNVFDKSGSPIYGLFGPDQSVGFDDFFIFADFFGLDASSEDFDPAFDLSRNNKIDFDDFFVFADNFGRSVEAAGKAVPTLAAGLNPEASLFLEAAADLPRVGEEMVIDVGLADFAELKGYGFTVNFDSDRLEFVKVLGGADLLGGTELAQPHLVAQADGEISIAAFGQTVDKGELDMRLVFRPTMEIEDSRIYFSEGQLRDSNYGVNQVERLGEVQIQTRPEVFALADNYPNPFNPETTIKYALPEAVEVRLDIYNMLGQMVRTMVAENQSPGRYVVRWDATDDSGSDLSTGIYFYRLRAGDFLETKKMLLLK